MNQLDFNIKAGWPASTETWEYLQNMILQAQKASLLGGKNCILSGCVESGGNVTDGIICVNGEVLIFVGGPAQPKVIIVDAPVKREFFGGALNDYYHNRIATFGSGTGEVLWTDFKRNNPDNGVLARLDKVEKMLKPLMGYEVGGVTQYGSWLFWGRPAAEIPTGWEAVPDADWKGRVPVVIDVDDVDFNTVGKVGGEKKHSLTENEMPSHYHPVFGDTRLGGSLASGNYPQKGDPGSNYLIAGSPTVPTVGRSGSIGGGQTHNNLQPFKVVMFIRFIG